MTMAQPEYLRVGNPVCEIQALDWVVHECVQLRIRNDKDE
jgi:hypothetical protein